MTKSSTRAARLAASLLAAALLATLPASAFATDPLVKKACDRMIALTEAPVEKRPDAEACYAMMSRVHGDCKNAAEVLECVAAIDAPDAIMACAEKCVPTAEAHFEGDGHDHHGHGHGVTVAPDPTSPEGRACTRAISLLRSEAKGGDNPDDLAACVADLTQIGQGCPGIYAETLSCIERASAVDPMLDCLESCERAGALGAAPQLPQNIKPATAEVACTHLARLSQEEGQVVVEEDMPKCRASLERIASDCGNPAEVLGCIAAIESTETFMDCALVCKPKP